ncbi:primosome, DnaD subunit [Ammonifex degensii KC4]|uniref:Primosome, DnaD subunit n=1 Tax=Ammonifex degensii (strain DSM 10501 / KC4) TaxID=429009 RepID=C9RC73_AMMDK|nr:DnaD domain protein [Ammonifex degensii]ACX51850.1 primosome, DnaD subunit [Ammonifex degensii KC4]
MQRLKRAVIKEELVALTGDTLEALILNQFIYWSERVEDFDRFIQEEKERAEQEGIELNFPLTGGWITKKMSELKEELMVAESEATIKRKVQSLVDKGYLEKRQNPLYKWDRTLQYRVNLVKIAQDLSKLGYHLEGYKADLGFISKDPGTGPHSGSFSSVHRERSKVQNELSRVHGEPSKVHGELSSAHGEPSSAHPATFNSETTAEITTETTAENLLLDAAADKNNSPDLNYSPVGNNREELRKNGQEIPVPSQEERAAERAARNGEKPGSFSPTVYQKHPPESNSSPEETAPVPEDEGLYSPAFAELYRLFEGEFGRPLSPLEAEHVAKLAAGHPPELVKEALSRAVAAGRPRINYVRGILESWRRLNLRTLREVLEHEKAEERRKGEKKDGAAEDKKKALIRSLYLS